MNYHVIESVVLTDFVKQVRAFLRGGWKLHGDLIITVSGHSNLVRTYAQAITLESQDEVVIRK